MGAPLRDIRQQVAGIQTALTQLSGDLEKLLLVTTGEVGGGGEVPLPLVPSDQASVIPSSSRTLVSMTSHGGIPLARGERGSSTLVPPTLQSGVGKTSASMARSRQSRVDDVTSVGMPSPARPPVQWAADLSHCSMASRTRNSEQQQ